MISTSLTLALLAAQASAQPTPHQTPALSLQAQASLRCSAAFALVSYGQAAGDPAALAWPAIDPGGREYFVRTMAKIMDETGIDRDQAAALAEREAKRLLDAKEVDAVMPACLQLLESSGL